MCLCVYVGLVLFNVGVSSCSLDCGIGCKNYTLASEKEPGAVPAWQRVEQ